MFYIKKLNLYNFRCYKKYSIEFAPNINIIYGNNAVGKTSLVEAVHCLGLCKSHKALTDTELITKGENYSIIKTNIINNSQTDEVILSIIDKKKKVQRNNKIINKLSEYIGYFNVVIFAPEDLDIIKGSPLERRKFLDINISQIKPKYLDSLINYRKLLKQRNELLKDNCDDAKYDEVLLKIITESLIQEAKIIIEERQSFINNINPYYSSINKSISNNNDDGYIKYSPNVSVDKIDNEFTNKLKMDIMLKTTTIGPHRDDFQILINKEDASIYASQGQQRTLSLSIKLALAELIKENKKNLIIILDDVFSELDTNRQNQILKLLDQKNQIFITTTSIDNLSKKLLDQSKIIEINKESKDDE